MTSHNLESSLKYSLQELNQASTNPHLIDTKTDIPETDQLVTSYYLTPMVQFMAA